MRFKKVFVVEGNVANDTHTVGDESEFVGVAEVPVDVHLLYGRISVSVRSR